MWYTLASLKLWSNVSNAQVPERTWCKFRSNGSRRFLHGAQFMLIINISSENIHFSSSSVIFFKDIMLF